MSGLKSKRKGYEFERETVNKLGLSALDGRRV